MLLLNFYDILTFMNKEEIQIRKFQLQDEIKAAIEKFMDDTEQSVKDVHITKIEGIAGDNGFDFSVLAELE